MSTTKIANILFIFRGPVDKADSPYFCDKYKMLSGNYQGAILSSTWQDYEAKFGTFTIYAWGLRSRWCKPLMLIRFAWFVLHKACYLHFRVMPFQVIVCADPLFSGTTGFVLKHIFGCKLIIEVNGDILQAGLLQNKNYWNAFKLILYKVFINTALLNADGIRLLYKGQLSQANGLISKKKIFYFHDFVPTHFFENKVSARESVILFAGYPFYIKGVDILVRAFLSICEKFPAYTLKLVGHKLEEDAKKYIPNLLNSSRVMLLRPMPYELLRDEIMKCYCFVLPSREEGMGRVLLEAMACGKPVIGSRLPGISNIVEHKKNGLLFEREDVDDLASKLDFLLANPREAESMGNYGEKLIEEKYSSQKYVDYFSKMITDTLNQN